MKCPSWRSCPAFMFPSSQSVAVITVSVTRFLRDCHSCLTGNKAMREKQSCCLSHTYCAVWLLLFMPDLPVWFRPQFLDLFSLLMPLNALQTVICDQDTVKGRFDGVWHLSPETLYWHLLYSHCLQWITIQITLIFLDWVLEYLLMGW